MFFRTLDAEIHFGRFGAVAAAALVAIVPGCVSARNVGIGRAAGNRISAAGRKLLVTSQAAIRLGDPDPAL